ncbi:MAG TPA: metal-dependent hydrolase [Anaerolineales bacterium]|nr:metal-dependent hydrolase [Anaerolineales bacterium]
MPQSGIHAIVGMASRKWMPQKEWLLLGVVLGNMFPDLDNLVVACATLAKLPDPEHYHRTFTHSVFTIIAMVILFYLVAVFTKNEKWKNFGIGFGAGIVMHVLVDLVLWFNGVELLWPLGGELNFWSWFVMPAWLKILLDTGEFLAFGFYFLMLGSLAIRYGTDANRRGASKTWAYIEFALFALFTAVFFTIGTKGLQYQVYGGLYLISLIAGLVITAQMKDTVESL